MAVAWVGMNGQAARGAVLIIAATFIAGCEPEPTYQGRPASEWVSLSRDSDGDTREQAFDALSRLKETSGIAKARLDEAYQRAGDNGSKVRYGVRLWPDRADETFAYAEKAIREQADAQGHVYSIDGIRSLVLMDDQRAPKLADDLEYGQW